MRNKYITITLFLLAINLTLGCMNESSEVEKSRAIISTIIGKLSSDDINQDDLEVLFNQLNDFTSHESVFVRNILARALGDLGAQNARRYYEYSIPILVTLLDENGTGATRVTVRSIGEYGEFAFPAIEYLLEIVEKYPNQDAGWFAAEAIGKIGPRAESAVPTLLKYIGYEGSSEIYRFQLRNKIIEALGNIGPQAKDALPYLESILNDHTISQSVRRKTINAVTKIMEKKDSADPRVQNNHSTGQP